VDVALTIGSLPSGIFNAASLTVYAMMLLGWITLVDFVARPFFVLRTASSFIGVRALAMYIGCILRNRYCLKIHYELRVCRTLTGVLLYLILGWFDATIECCLMVLFLPPALLVFPQGSCTDLLSPELRDERQQVVDIVIEECFQDLNKAAEMLVDGTLSKDLLVGLMKGQELGQRMIVNSGASGVRAKFLWSPTEPTVFQGRLCHLILREELLLVLQEIFINVCIIWFGRTSPGPARTLAL